jgi:hypothetical protein
MPWPPAPKQEPAPAQTGLPGWLKTVIWIVVIFVLLRLILG